MNKRGGILLLLALLIGLFFLFDLQQYSNLDYLKASHDELRAIYQNRPFFVLGVYALIYIVVTALSLPGATIMTLRAGQYLVFGWVCRLF